MMDASIPDRDLLSSAGEACAFLAVLRARHHLNRAVREFFWAREYIETETPVRIPRPALEEHIDAEPSGNAWLRTSPELHMKRLVAAGLPRIFQIAPCFRKNERGALHNPEYVMLEWYRTPTDYLGILEETRELLQQAAIAVHGAPTCERNGCQIRLDQEWERITVREAFLRFAGWDPTRLHNPDRFELDLLDRVEPALPADRPVVLIDYPAPMGALARLKKGEETVAERWELYLGGIEIANAYSELTDPGEQRKRFRRCAEGRAERGQDVYELDAAFLESLRHLPPTGGIALGMDRLLMLLLGKDNLDQIMPFREAAGGD
jgi:elongation factor P--(R)-beta-lysine ligase